MQNFLVFRIEQNELVVIGNPKAVDEIHAINQVGILDKDHGVAAIPENGKARELLNDMFNWSLAPMQAVVPLQ